MMNSVVAIVASFLLVGLSFLLNSFFPATPERTAIGEGAIEGLWAVAVDTAFYVEIEKREGVYEGTIVWLRDSINAEGSIKTDELNPDPELRSRTFKGIKVLNDMVFKEDGVYCCGQLYDPESGNTYKCRIALESKNVAHIRGFVGIPLLGKTVVFRRVTW